MKGLIDRIGESERKYVMEVLDSNFRSSKGSLMMTRLEKAFADKFDVKYAISHINGTATLHSAIAAARVGIGDEVIVPPLTMSATTFAVLQNNAKPVFADVEEDTFNISPKSIRNCITDRTKAIIPVSLYGLPCDIDEIMKIAQEYNLKVIEDNAQCFLGKVNGKIAGTCSDMASFSFQSSKHMTSGEGGIIITDDDQLAEDIRRFSSLGYIGVGAGKGKISKEDIQDPNYERHCTLGWNYRMPELCSAVALAQLEHLDELVKRRIDVARLFLNVVENCEWLRAQYVPTNFEPSYWTLAVKIMDERISWNEFRNVFVANGGDGIYGAWKLTYLEPMFRNLTLAGREVFLRKNDSAENPYKQGICPVAEKLQPRLLQFKTNYWNWQQAEQQADILEKTIKVINKKI